MYFFKYILKVKDFGTFLPLLRMPSSLFPFLFLLYESIHLNYFFFLPAVVKARKAKIKRLQLLRAKRTVEQINLKSLNLLNLHHLNGLNPMHQSKRWPPKITTVRPRSNPQVRDTFFATLKLWNFFNAARYEICYAELTLV